MNLKRSILLYDYTITGWLEFLMVAKFFIHKLKKEMIFRLITKKLLDILNWVSAIALN